MDLAAFFAETAASIDAADAPNFPGFPGSRPPSGNGQVIDNKGVSRTSRNSRAEIKGSGFSENEKPQAGASVRASVRARDHVIEPREMREMRETLAGSEAYLSRYPSTKREKERETGNFGPLLAASTVIDALAGQTAVPLDSQSLSLWRTAFARLIPGRIPCPGYTSAGWAETHARAVAFLDTFGQQAEALGWTAHRLFNVHPEAGIIRVDACGGLVLPIGGPVRAITATTISFGHLTHREKPGQPRGVLIWEFGQ